MKYNLLATLLLTGFTATATPVLNERAQDASRFAYADFPTPLAAPCDLINGPDGAVYILGLLSNSFARLDPTTMKITDQYFIPFTTAPLGNATLPNFPGLPKPFLSCALVEGYDGYIYGSNGIRNQLARLDIKTKEVVVFTVPNILGNLQPLNELTAAPDGIYLTQTTGNAITKFDYNTHEFTSTQVPTLLAGPAGIYYASDGGIWFLELFANKFGRFDRTTKAIREFSLPPSLFGPLTLRAETRTASAPGSQYLWFTGGLGGHIGRIDIATGNTTAYPIDLLGLSLPVELCPALADETIPKTWAPGESDIYFSYLAKASLGKINSATKQVTEIPYPDSLLPIPGLPINPPQILGTGIWCNPGPYIWFTEISRNRIGRYAR